jgi:type II secretory pathway pseudopilin PulG
MRGRIASFAIGSAVGSRRAQATMKEQQEAQQQGYQQAQKEQQSQQAQQKAAQPQQEDITQKLEKLADLHKQGILTDEEFQKMKADLIAKL